jgi:sirohydrochlorin cobaltochelatase
MYRHDALLLIGHGSGRYADAARLLEHHAACLRTRGRFAEVAVGLLSGRPSVAAALSALAAATVHVVPYFIEEGYFARTAIPDALRGAGDSRPLRQCPPVGVHDGIAGIAQRRALEACAKAGLAASHVTLILLALGSARAPGRLMAARDHAQRLARAGAFADVRAAFLEEAPSLPNALPRDGRPAAVIGLFLGEGGHVRGDMPRLIAAARRHRPEPLLDLGIVGDDSAMPDIILDQVACHAGDMPRPAR